MTAPAWITHLGWALLDFVWQGALIGCAAAVALLCLRNARPEARYAVACTGLLLCLAWPATELALRLTHDGGASIVMRAPLGMLLGGAMQADGERMDFLLGNLNHIVGAWACCAGLLGLRLVLGLVWVRRTVGGESGDPQWQARLSAMAGRFGIERAVRLRIVDKLASPVTAGWLKPVVLVPAALIAGMPPHLLEALLAHELAHVRRCDYLVNLMQSVVETILFYHPAVWWLSSRIRSEREQIADDFAARQLGEPRRLALALSELERLQFSTHHLAQSANGGDLMSRIKRLVCPDTQALTWKAAIPALGLAFMTATVFAHAAPAAKPAKVVEPDVHAVANFQSCKKPAYPEEAVKLKAEGTVTVDFLVGTRGEIKDSRVLKSSGRRDLDEATRAALLKCSFQPAKLKGKPVESWAKVQYVWSLG